MDTNHPCALLATLANPTFFACFFVGCQVYDFGDLSFTEVQNDEVYNNLVNYPRSVGSASQVLADTVHDAVAAGRSCVTIGGDHR